MSVNSKMKAIADEIRRILGLSNELTLDDMATKLGGISVRSAQTINPSLSTQTVPAGNYLSGAQTVAPVTAAALTSLDSDFQASNIKKDVNIFGVTGTYEGSGGGVPLPATITAGDTPVALISLPGAVQTGSSLAKHGQITVAKSGTYRVKYSFHQQDNNTATTAIYKNGTKVSGNYTAKKDTVSVSYDLACQAGDTVEVWGEGGTNILTQRWLAYGHMALCIDWDNTF